MKKNSPIFVHEFGTLIKSGQHVFLNDREDEVELSNETFENLWNFILENKTSDDLEQVMSVHQKKGRKYIKCNRYVGTVQTKDGCTIEILPKIYASSEKKYCDIQTSRKVFLNMLKHFRDTKSLSFQNANLLTCENFPILESYVFNYLSEVENLLRIGIKKNYTKVQENSSFLKGKFLISKQISINVPDNSRFQIEYSKYLEDIPQNRIIVSTLYKLNKISYNSSNKAKIFRLLSIFSEIPQSKNIISDLQISFSSNRLYDNYRNLLNWSNQFLLNKGFTTFSGNHVNQSLLFSAEKLFENYVAALIKSYITRHPGYNVFTQHRKYYLVDKHNKHGKFQLRPDIFVESADKSDFTSYENIILDTKWKIIDEKQPDKNYLMNIHDMYQLYSYGQKYSLGEGYYYDVHPKLVLIYPATSLFTKKLSPFFYEDIKKEYGLQLSVCPFNLSILNQEDMDKQIQNILEIVNRSDSYDNENDLKTDIIFSKLNHNPNKIIRSNSRYMFFGYVKSKAHLKWINDNMLFNVKIGETFGAISEDDIVINPSRIILFNDIGETWICTIDQSEDLYLDVGKMLELRYPEPHADYYRLFRIENIMKSVNISIEDFKKKYNCYQKDSDNKWKPFFVKY